MDPTDPDQARQNMEPALNDTLMVFQKDFFEKVNFEKNMQMTKNQKNFPACRCWYLLHKL